MRLALLVVLPFLLASPAWSQSADEREARSYERGCDHASGENLRWCELNLREWRTQYLKAKRGDYQSQRNTAYKLGDNFFRDNLIQNPVRENALQACAWRIVILQQGHAQANDFDARSYRRDCGRPEVVLGAAEARARQILLEISRNPPLPPPPPPRQIPERCLDSTVRELRVSPNDPVQEWRPPPGCEQHYRR